MAAEHATGSGDDALTREELIAALADARRSEARWRGMVENANDIVYTLSTDGVFLYVSPNWTEVLGHDVSEVEGRPFVPFVHPDDVGPCLVFLERALATGEKQRGIEYRVRHQDGSWRWHTSNASIVISPEGETTFAGIARDITDRKRAEEALRAARDELEERVRERTLELRELNRDLQAEIARGQRTEASRSESESKYRALFESARDAIFVLEGGRFVDCNPRALELFGCARDEMIGQPPDAFSTETQPDGSESAAAARERIRLALGGRPQSFEWRHRRLDGTPFDCDVSLNCLELSGKLLLLGIVRDVSDRKRTEEALRDSELQFRTLANATHAHIFITQDGRFVYANRAVLEYFGMSWETFAATAPADLLVEEALIAGHRAMAEAERTGASHCRFEFRHPVDGRWIETHVSPLELHGRPALISTSFDITERKRAEEAVRESEARYRTIFETAGTGMITFDEDCVIRLANAEVTKLTGYSREEMEGKMTWMQLFTDASVEMMLKFHAKRRREPDTVPRSYESQMRTKDGRSLDGIVTIQLVPGTSHRVTSFLDLTARKQVEQQMFRAEKMAALGQIIAGVAHEINNPNNFIYFNLPILRQYVDALRPSLEACLAETPDLRFLNMPYDVFIEDVYKLLDNMQHGSSRITEIVSDLRTYVRSHEDDEKRAENPKTVIDRVMTMVGKQVRKTVREFDVRIDDPLPLVMMHAGKIEQVLVNLVINAGHAADKEDSWVRLTAGRATADPGKLAIVVEDNGRGIEPDIIGRIFDPFFTTKGRESGTGLGLAISLRTVEEHGGTITVKSTPGEGARFTILLPIHEEESE